MHIESIVGLAAVEAAGTVIFWQRDGQSDAASVRLDSGLVFQGPNPERIAWALRALADAVEAVELAHVGASLAGRFEARSVAAAREG